MRRHAVLAMILSLTLPGVAMAHAELTDPVPRSQCINAMNCKTAPCGTVPAGAVMKTFYVGSSYTITWDETIDHTPGRYRLALSTNGETAFDTFVVMDYGVVADVTGPISYDWTWTVPDTQNCNPCVMQLIQGMDDNNDGVFVDYFNCADIRILPAGSTPPPTPTPTATPTPGGNPNDPVEVEAYGSCGCSVDGGLAAGSTVAPAILLALAMLRRRRSAR